MSTFRYRLIPTMARQKWFMSLVMVLSVLGVIGVIVMKSSLLQQSIHRIPDREGGFEIHVTVQAAEKFRKQRNELSKTLNKVKQEIAAMSCEMIDLYAKLNRTLLPSVSTAGGWCRQTSRSEGGSHICDKSLAEQLSIFFQNQTVASFGDGPGDYKKYLDSTRRLLIYDAFDGAPYGPETSGGVVRFLDLTAPQYGLPIYDWIISLEVAEHIPSQYEEVYVDNIARHAKIGIVLSWAVPGQGGLSHVNNRPLSYVQSVLSGKGFEPDMAASNVLQKQATLPWLKTNIYVYRRRYNSEARQDEA
ncbi:uncharacterized protein [Haliotis cracherodii]|uniref:uncharacterized protein n=1 Tax=Haliotis cracherodii TaxID=6455 RepID=UPI0039EB520E